MFSVWLGKNRLKKRPPKDSYLEVVVREGVSEVDVNSVIQALSTISSFFGARIVVGSGGGGGGRMQKKRRSHQFSLPPSSVVSEKHIGKLL